MGCIVTQLIHPTIGHDGGLVGEGVKSLEIKKSWCIPYVRNESTREPNELLSPSRNLRRRCTLIYSGEVLPTTLPILAEYDEERRGLTASSPALSLEKLAVSGFPHDFNGGDGELEPDRLHAK